MELVLVSLFVVGVIGALQQPCAGLTVTVDPNGGDDTACRASNESCRSVDGALKTLGSSDVITCTNITCSRGTVDNFTDEAVIMLADGNHILTSCVGIVASANIRFQAVNEGAAVIKCATMSTDVYDNLFVCDSRNISFHGIRFEGCGPFSSNVFFTGATDILFENCIFRNNSGSPLQFRFSTGIRLIGCDFVDNLNENEAPPDTEGVSIVDIYDVNSTSGGVTIFTRGRPLEILIQGCTFTSNRASRNAPNNTRPVLLKTNGHGGGVLIRLVECSDSNVTIEDSIFTGNMAEVDGGAVYLSMSEDSTNNWITFRDNVFSSNVVEVASGGAISINSFNFTFNNSILVERCNFTENRGDSGGGFSMALYNSNSNSVQSPDHLQFRDCSFYGNQAENEGTAVGLFSLVHVDQVGFPVYFEDCTFTNNTSLESAQDTSAVAAFRFPTVFSGSTHFEGNIGGGITLLNTRMQVMMNASLLFLRNRAVFGGGISMDDRCLLELRNNVNLTFQENVATESGGGIYVEFPPIRFVVDIFNRLCFLQYNNGSGIDAPPQEWNDVVIRFVGNRARLSGAAIFASDMQQCGWLGSVYTSEGSLIFDPPENLTMEYPKYPFQYIKNELGREVESSSPDLATSPANIHAIVEHVLVQPGETLEINLLATDQVANSREAIWSVEAPGVPPNLDALSANNDTYMYAVPSATVLAGMTAAITTSSTSCDMMGGRGSTMPMGTAANMSDVMEQTPPPPTTTAAEETTPSTTADPQSVGVIQDNFTASFTLNFSLLRTLGTVQPLTLNVAGCHPGYRLNSDGECECDLNGNSRILRCDSNSRYLYLREGIWGGVEVVDGQRVLVTARVQPGYVVCEPQGRLPGCLFKFDNVTAQCSEGRNGMLCGNCSEGRGVTLDLTGCSGQSCYIGLALFLIVCVGVVILSFLILLFDIEIPNEIKGFVFYAQVIGLVYSPYVVVQTPNDLNVVLRVLLNLLGLSLPFPACLSQSLRAHHVALLGYVSPLLTICCVFLFVLGTRFIRALGRHSALKGITFLSLFVYKYIADAAFIFISCVQTESDFLFQYDGSQSCLGGEFLPFFLIGLLLVVFFVVPTPVAVSYICVKRPQKFQQYADVLTKGLRTKHRWWGGWDIFRRLPFVFIGFFIVILRPSMILFLMSLAALTVLLVHLFTKPFQKMYINVIEAAILLDLLLVTVAYLDPSNTPVPVYISTILLLLPYAYALCYLFYITIGHRIWKKVMAQRELAKKAPPSSSDGTTAAGSGDGSAPVAEGSQRSDSAAGTSGSARPAQPSISQQGGGATRTTELTTSGEMDYIHYREPLLDDD